jgi:hypothetical protein
VPLPDAFALQAGYPNPFNVATTIPYGLPAPATVRLAVYDVAGREVAVLQDGYQEAGRYRVSWDGRDHSGRALASGVYLCRLTLPGFAQARTVLLLR